VAETTKTKKVAKPSESQKLVLKALIAGREIRVAHTTVANKAGTSTTGRVLAQVVSSKSGKPVEGIKLTAPQVLSMETKGWLSRLPDISDSIRGYQITDAGKEARKLK